MNFSWKFISLRFPHCCTSAASSSSKVHSSCTCITSTASQWHYADALNMIYMGKHYSQAVVHSISLQLSTYETTKIQSTGAIDQHTCTHKHTNFHHTTQGKAVTHILSNDITLPSIWFGCLAWHINDVTSVLTQMTSFVYTK